MGKKLPTNFFSNPNRLMSPQEKGTISLWKALLSKRVSLLSLFEVWAGFDLVGGGWVVVVVEGVVVQDQDQLAILSRTKRDPTKSTKKKIYAINYFNNPIRNYSHASF
jgi:hypothetical protein